MPARTILPRGGGPSALHIAPDTGIFYGRRGHPLDQERLDIAWMLIERGGNVNGVADRLDLDDVMKL